MEKLTITPPVVQVAIDVLTIDEALLFLGKGHEGKDRFRSHRLFHLAPRERQARIWNSTSTPSLVPAIQNKREFQETFLFTSRPPSPSFHAPRA